MVLNSTLFLYLNIVFKYFTFLFPVLFIINHYMEAHIYREEIWHLKNLFS